MEQKLVSVNITTYNRAPLLLRCLEGIVSQSYENLEIIVADDCSTDNTQEVIQSLQAKDPRIKYFKHEKNLGNAHARNTALENCNGYYVAFMDDDDEWIDHKKIEKQVNIFESSQNDNLGIICSSVRLFSSKDKYWEKKIVYPDDIRYTFLKANGTIYSPTVMTKRHIIIEVGGFDTNLTRGIDSDFYRNCLVKHNYDLEVIPDFTTAIHEYGDGRMTDITIQSLQKHIDAQLYKYKKYPNEIASCIKADAVINKTIFILYLRLFKRAKNLNSLANSIKFGFKMVFKNIVSIFEKNCTQ